MKSNDFIKKHIKCDNREILSKRLRQIAEKHQEFARYLFLIQKKDVFEILLELQKEQFIFIGCLTNLVKHQARYYLNKLVGEEFIIETTNINEENITRLENYFGSGNVNKMTFYELTEKGKDFLSIDIVKEFMKNEL